MNVPNFFIIGAPKCGTTSVSGWLKDHPRVFVCAEKEPFFFSSDINSIRIANSMPEYLKLFSIADNQHLAIGEASTTYLRSRVAVPNILTRFPEAKFIVCLRNPIDMVPSVHAQLVRGGRENERDLRTAWRLQEVRRSGCQVPSAVIEPRDLQYGEMCRLGSQVQRLMELVSRDKVLFVFLEDLARKPRVTYRQVLDFLGLPDDGKREFQTENSRAVPRSLILSVLLTKATILKNRLGLRRSMGIGGVMANLISRKLMPEEKESMDAEFREELVSYFSEDINLLAGLIDRDLSHWLE